MMLRTYITVWLVLVFALGTVPAHAANPNGTKSMNNFGSNFFSVSPPCPVSQFPTFETIAPIPPIIDPFEDDLIPMFCQIKATQDGNNQKGIIGNFETSLIVRDNDTGDMEEFPIKKGRFNTRSQGFAEFDFDIPTELFADGFESGDVSAWSYTRSDFSNKKRKADGGVQVCGPRTGGSQ